MAFDDGVEVKEATPAALKTLRDELYPEHAYVKSVRPDGGLTVWFLIAGYQLDISPTGEIEGVGV